MGKGDDTLALRTLADAALAFGDEHRLAGVARNRLVDPGGIGGGATRGIDVQAVGFGVGAQEALLTLAQVLGVLVEVVGRDAKEQLVGDKRVARPGARRRSAWRAAGATR